MFALWSCKRAFLGRNPSWLFGTNHCFYTSTQHNSLSLTRSKCTNPCYRSVAQRKLPIPGDHVKRTQLHIANNIHAQNNAQCFGSRTSGRHLFIEGSFERFKPLLLVRFGYSNRKVAYISPKHACFREAPSSDGIELHIRISSPPQSPV